ncbi:MAG: flagellar protein FlgN [Thermodesulfobacteriota bacterium]
MEKLVEILKSELLIYNELFALLSAERELLKTRSKDDLYNLTGDIETLAYKVKGLEVVRGAEVSALSSTLGLAGEVSLKRIIDNAPSREKQELTGLRASLVAILTDITNINRENGVMIDRSINNIKGAFNFLRDLSSVDTYSSDGKVGA